MVAIEWDPAFFSIREHWASPFRLLVTWCLCHPAGHAFIFCCGAGNGQLVETAGSQTSLLPHAAKPTSNIQPTKNLTNLVEINGKTQRHHSISNRSFYDNMSIYLKTYFHHARFKLLAIHCLIKFCEGNDMFNIYELKWLLAFCVS